MNKLTQKIVLAFVFPIAGVLGFFAGAFLVQGVADLADAATVTTAVTPPPAVAKAMASVTHRYCEMDAGSQGRMQHRLSILGIETKIRTGIDWPLVMDYRETCEPTKAELHLYNQARQPLVKAVRDRYHVPVWNLKQTYQFCTKLEKRKGVKTTGIIGTLYLCPAIK